MRSFTLTVLLSMIAGCAGHGPRLRDPSDGRPSPVPHAPILALDAPPPGDGKLHVAKNYFAIESVGLPARHYVVWYHDEEPEVCHVAVANGNIGFDGCMFGGPAVHGPIAPLPPDHAEEGARIEEAIRTRNPRAREFAIRYGGDYRQVALTEFILLDSHAHGRVGWVQRHELLANADLSAIESDRPASLSMWFGGIDVAASAARVDVPLTADEDGRTLGDPARYDRVVQGTLAVARAIDAGKPVPTFGPLWDAPIDCAIPDSFDQPTMVLVAITGRNAKEPATLRVRVPIHPNAARSGSAIGTSEGDVSGIHVRATATLSGLTIGDPPAIGCSRPATGELALHVEDTRGNRFDQTYGVKTSVLEGSNGVVIVGGLDLAGGRRDTTWPGNAVASTFFVAVDMIAWSDVSR